MLPTKFQVNWPFGANNRFQNGDHLGFPIGTILTIFNLQVSLMLSTKFQVNCLSSSGEERNIDFQEAKYRLSIFPKGMILTIFDLQVTVMFPAKFQDSRTFGLGEEAKNRFSRPSLISDWNGGHFEFPIGTILAIFDLQVTSMLPSELQIKWSFGSREEAKN